MIPTEKEENVEIIYEKGSYSGMLNALNPNPIPGGIIERRKKFIFYFPDKKNATEIKNENLKKEKEKKELEKLVKGNIRARYNPKINEVIAVSKSAQAFLE
jgi:hypothetical protein